MTFHVSQISVKNTEKTDNTENTERIEKLFWGFSALLIWKNFDLYIVTMKLPTLNILGIR